MPREVIATAPRWTAARTRTSPSTKPPPSLCPTKRKMTRKELLSLPSRASTSARPNINASAATPLLVSPPQRLQTQLPPPTAPTTRLSAPLPPPPRVHRSQQRTPLPPPAQPATQLLLPLHRQQQPWPQQPPPTTAPTAEPSPPAPPAQQRGNP